MTDSTRFGELLRSARKARGWGQLRLIREMRAAAAQQGQSLPTDASVKRRIASWENGHSVPDEFYGPILCRALDMSAAELGLTHLTGQDAGLLDAGYPVEAGAAVASMIQLWRADLNGYEPLINSEASEASWHEASVTWLVAPPPSPLALGDRHGVRVGLADVASIKATADMFAHLDDHFGGDHARHSVIQYLSRDVAPLLQGQFRESVGRALFSTVAETTLLAGWMSYDSGHHGLAQRYLLRALRLAQEGDDRRLAGSVLSAMSHQANYLAQSPQAVTLARAALMGISGVATPTLRAQFHAMEARALARAGDVRGCELALAQASKALESRNSGDEPEWITYFDETELADEAAHSYNDLRIPEKAAEHAQQAISGHHVRSDFFATMMLADARLQAGEVEEACRVALDALDLGEQLKSARCVSYLAEFRQELAQVGDTAAARDFYAQAAEHRLWLATSGA